MHRTTQEVNDALAGFELGEAQQKLYDFIWDDYCDWYIEMAKLRFRSGSGPSPLPVLVHVLERTLRLLHPFMPFITEEIWQHLRSALPQSQSSEEGLSESIMVASYPQANAACLDTQAEEEISLVMRAVRAIRNARAQLRIPSSQPLEALVDANGWQQTIEEEAEALRALSRVEPLRILAGDIPQPGAARGISLVVSPLSCPAAAGRSGGPGSRGGTPAQRPKRMPAQPGPGVGPGVQRELSRQGQARGSGT